MKFDWIFVVLFYTLAVCQDASNQDQLARALELLKTMPQCALTCLVSAVAASGKTAGNIDLKSSCSNTTATAVIEKCALEACTIREQLTAKNVTETLCERPVREVEAVPVSRIVGFTFAALAYLMRMASKVFFPCERGGRIDVEFWWDDATITFAFLLAIPISAFSLELIKLGFGRDVWTIPHANITQLLKLYYFAEMMYIVALPAIKIAILLTYLRIFQSKHFRMLVYGALGLNVAYIVAFLFATIFQCSPIDLAWHHWDEAHPGHCNNVNAQSWASAAFNIVLDLIVVILPMPMLWRMELNKRKRVLVMLMFGVGLFVTIVSILRLQILVKFGDSKNMTYDYKAVGYWSIVELHTAIVCACMPGIRNLIRRAFPKLMGQSTANSNTPSNLSGRTAVSSGIDKNGNEVFVRPRHSDDEAFIPLENVSTHKLVKARTQPLTPDY
ncbi:Putative extracellular membrane protein, CFEM [Septoria linicola]|uniref:Extracellular membrane protein, CFEM n=1 Tax=Septoria linicola TaxID=215465 RepID=A0A9Q9AZ47_9PEZI|nr:Putative extracellular membrane protein, CFEM [Septoria linicola]